MALCGFGPALDFDLHYVFVTVNKNNKYVSINWGDPLSLHPVHSVYLTYSVINVEVDWSIYKTWIN